MALIKHILNNSSNFVPQFVCLHCQVNAFEVRLDVRGEVGRGVFPLLGRLNHSCVSNARYTNHGRAMECRAAVEIPAGTEILDHYTSPVITFTHIKALILCEVHQLLSFSSLIPSCPCSM